MSLNYNNEQMNPYEVSNNDLNGFNFSLTNKENYNINTYNNPTIKERSPLTSKNNLESYLKMGLEDNSKINGILTNGISNQDPSQKSFLTKRTKAVTMKIRISSIRDRWLMNIREFDYEIYLSSAFLLILTKKKIEFVKETEMLRLVNQDAQNLLHFIE